MTKDNVTPIVRVLGSLYSVTSVLPNPDLPVAMYVRREAVLSTQIEGTQSSLDDVLQFEVARPGGPPRDIEEVVNYAENTSCICGRPSENRNSSYSPE